MGDYYTEDEIREIERRARKRQTADGSIPDEMIRGRQLRAVAPNVTPSRQTIADRDWRARTGEAPKTCKGCGAKMQRLPMQGTDRRVYCTAECRGQAERARAKARRLAERMVG